MNISILSLVILIVVSVGSVILHELAHGLVAYWLGDNTAKLSGRLTLNPIKHIDPLMSIVVPVMLALAGMPIFGGAKPVPINTRNLKFREYGFALVALAGPLMNLILAFIFFLIGHFSGVFYGDEASIGAIVCLMGVRLNLGYLLFNIIPIPPLDGSRVLYALAPEGARRVMESMERYGLVIIYALILLCGTALSVYMMNGSNGILNAFYWIVGVR